MWIYTKLGEETGKKYGFSRPAGQPAMCGNEPVKGPTAQAWLKIGYIEWKECEQDEI